VDDPGFNARLEQEIIFSPKRLDLHGQPPI